MMLVKHFQGEHRVDQEAADAASGPEAVEGGAEAEPVKAIDPTTFAEASALQNSVDPAIREKVPGWMEKLSEANVANEDRADAHFWLGSRKLGEVNAGPGQREAENQGEYHFKRAIALNRLHEEAYSALAQLYLKQGRRSEALLLLENGVKDLPGLGIMLAGALDVTRETPAAVRTHAENAAAHWRKILEDDPENFRARVQLATAEMLLGNDGSVNQLLEGDLTQEERDSTSDYDHLEVSLKLRQAVRALRQQPPLIDEAVSRLDEALQIAPSHPSAIRWLSDLGVNVPQARPKAKAVFQRMVEDPKADWRVHLALAMQFLPEKNYTEAKTHLARAYEINPSDLILANNYAWCLTQEENPQWETALRVIDDMLAKNTDMRQHPELRATRGTILVQLGKEYLEAAQKAQDGTKKRGADLVFSHSHRNLEELGLQAVDSAQ